MRRNISHWVAGMLKQTVQRRRALKRIGWACAVPGLALAAPPRLTLATGAREPLVSTPGHPGFAEEVAREACRRIGHELQVLVLPVERALANANAGVEDGDLYRATGFEAEYPNLLQVPEPLVEQDFVAFTRRPDVALRDWSDLARYEVAYITGQTIIERHLPAAPNVLSVRDSQLLMGLLAKGRVDLVVHNRWVGLVDARRLGLAVRVLEPPLQRVPMFIYLHRRHQALVPQLAAALAQMRRDGSWQRLYDQILKPLVPT
jgi:polar amino acid transport system substrate-binding protein